MSKPFRIGILGCGGIANVHAKILQQHPRAELVAFCDVDPSRAAQFNRDYCGGKAQEFADASAMYDKAKLDAVWVCLPPFAHNGQIEEAAKRGIHIFTEKPLALDFRRVESQINAVEKSGVRCLVGFMNRYGAAIERVKADIESGRAGKCGVIQVRYFCNSLHGPWWREKEKSGGQIVEQIVHSYDLARYLFGPVKSIYAYATNQFHQGVERYTSEDVSSSVIIFKNGAVGSVTGTNGAIPGKWINDYRVVTQFYTCEFSDSNNAVIYDTRDAANVEKITIESGRVWFRLEADDLFAAIDDKKHQVRCTLQDGAITQRLVLAASESAAKGKAIELNM